MNATKFREQVNLVERIIALCGESAINDASGLGCAVGPSVFLSDAGFAVLSAGQTINEKVYGGQREYFFYLHGMKFWRATSLSDQQPRAYRQAGTPIDLLGSDDSVLDEPCDSEAATKLYLDAREALVEQTVCGEAVTHG
jgi:hypothetical protein